MGFEAPEDILVMETSVSVHKEYALGEEIARGGMGRIYLATDPTLRREVAVKVSTVGQCGEDSMFFKEAKVLGRLAHPNIVPIHNLGEDRQGRPFYSMKLVKGRTLQAVLKALRRRGAPKTKRYSRAALISMFHKVCDAVAFAHSKGYLHRDIKPENVMLGEYGEVLLMDWGLAQEMVEGVAVSVSSEGGSGEEPAQIYIQGTPQYMSPEQANGTPLDVRSDVYSLGGLLFSLLTYRAPVEGKSVEEILSKVRSGEILPMNWLRADPFLHLLGAARQNEVPQSRAGTLGRKFGLKIGVPMALQAVTCKAMAFKREDRYQSVGEMLEDIEAYQHGFATEAEQAGLLRQILLLVRRNQAAAMFFVLLLVCAAIFTAQLAASESRATQSALLAKQEAQRATLNELEAKANTEEAHKQAGIAKANAKKALEEKEAARVASAELQFSFAVAADDQARGLEMQIALALVPEDLRGQPWRYINQRLNTATFSFEAKEASTWRDYVLHPLNPDLLVTLQYNGWVRSLELSSGAVADIVRMEPSGLRNCLAVSKDGKRLAVHRQLPQPTENGSQQLEIFNLADGEPQCSILMPANAELSFQGRLVFSPDGNLLLMSSASKSGVGFYMFDAWQGTLLWSGTQRCRAIASFSDKGNHNAIVCTDLEGISERDPWTGDLLRSSPLARLGGWRNINLAIPSWESVFFVRNGYCYRMETEGGKIVAKFPLPSGASFFGDIAYLPKQKVLGVIAQQSQQFGILQFWNVDTGDLLRSVPVPVGMDTGANPESPRWAIVAHPNTAQFIVTRGTQMKVWNCPSSHGEKVVRINSETKVDSFAFLSNPDLVAGSFWVADKVFNDWVGVWDMKAKATPVSLKYPFRINKRMGAVVTTDQSGELVCATMFGDGVDSEKVVLKLFRVNAEGATEIPLPPTKRIAGHGHISPNGKRIWTGFGILETDSQKPMRKLDRKGVLDPDLDERIPRWVGNSHVVEIVSLQEGAKPADELTAARHLLLWNVENGTRSSSVSAPYAKALAASPDGTQIAEGGSDKMLRIRDASTLAVQRVLRVHDGGVSAVAWHPKLPLLATASFEDRCVRIWDLNTETMLEEFGFFEFVDRLFWSIDGSELAVRNRGTNSQIEIFSPKACQKSGR